MINKPDNLKWSRTINNILNHLDHVCIQSAFWFGGRWLEERDGCFRIPLTARGRWLVERGGCFRIPLRARTRAELSVETDATHPRPSSIFRWKVARPDAGMPYILISTQIRLVRIEHEQRATHTRALLSDARHCVHEIYDSSDYDIRGLQVHVCFCSGVVVIWVVIWMFYCMTRSELLYSN